MSWPPPHADLVLEGRVDGEPKTAGSKNAGVIRSKSAPNPKTGKPDGKLHPVIVHTKDGGTTAKTFVTDSSGTPGKTWRSDIRNAVSAIYDVEEQGVLDAPLVVEAVFFRPHLSSHYGTTGKLLDSAPAYPAVRPDGTKLVRAFEDALTKMLWSDDSRIVSLRWDKRYVSITEAPRVQFAVWELPAKVGDLRLAEAHQEQSSLAV
jgi:Holliday junction resolvase RusA-like endonuclease